MKVFKFYANEHFYAYAGESEEECKKAFIEELGFNIDKTEKIPQEKWDEKMINSWEDNNFELEPDKLSINDVICGKYTQMVFTNDYSLF